MAIPVVALAMVPPRSSGLAVGLPGAGLAGRGVGGLAVHRAAVVNARHGAATMDTLVWVGVGAAYRWSLYALLFGGAGRAGTRMASPGSGRQRETMYLDVAAGVTTAVLAGRYLEARARARGRRAAGAAVAGRQDVAVLRDGSEERVPVTQLAVGEEFVVRPGEKIATDGVVA